MLVQMKRLALVGFLAALAAPPASHGQQDTGDLAAQIEELKRGQQEIRRQLQQIRALLQPRPAPSRPAGPDVTGKTFELGDNPVRGSTDARLVLVEFTDYQ